MKIIFIFCFSYIFCEVLFLEKYEQTLSVATSGCICLDVSEFDVDDTIHMHFSSHNGGIEDGIYYLQILMNQQINYAMRLLLKRKKVLLKVIHLLHLLREVLLQLDIILILKKQKMLNIC